ncbi:MAG TPA: ABC transporter permease [Candidatus Limnocylindrales bacterium]|nr:ABC transporter permease [Candidatus Limnocylindrales bacterium]
MSALGSAVTWSFGLWRLARGRIRADWRFLAGVWLLLACSTTLLASGIVYGDAVALGSLRSAIRSAPIAEQGVLVESSLIPAQVTLADPAVRSALTQMLGDPGGAVGLEVRSGSLVRVGAGATGGKGGTGGTGGTPQLTVLETIDDPAGHAALVSGRWPVAGRSPIEAVVSEGAAKSLGVAIGDVVPLGDASTPGADAAHPVATVTVVGIDRPDATDPFWAGDGLDLTGDGATNGQTYDGPFLVAAGDLAAGPTSRVDARWRAVPDLDQLTADGIEPLRARLDALSGAIRSSFPAGGSVNVDTSLSRRLDALSTQLGVARGAVLVLTLQFAVVAGYAVLLVSGMLADRRRPEIGLLRSRGGSTGHVAALAFGEALLLAVPAVVVAPFAAAGLVRLLGRVGPLAATGAVADASPSPTALVVIGVTGLIAALVLALPALASGAEVAGIRAVLGRPVARTLGQRLGIDVALLAVAAIAIWQLRAYGQPVTRSVTGVLGLDPLLAAAPAFGLVAGGVIATRLVPRLGEIGERLLSHLRGLLSPLVARQVARRPLRYTRAALLLILATALGTFGAVYSATWASSHADQAAYQAGADVRVEPGPPAAAPAWSLGAAYRSTPGVTAALPVGRTRLAIGNEVRDGVLLLPDAATAPSIMSMPPGDDAVGLAAGLEALAAARPSVPTVPLPEDATAIRLAFDAALTEPSTVIADGRPLSLPEDYRGIELEVAVQDGDGIITTFPATAGELGLFEGTRQTLDVAITDPSDPSRRPTGPRSLIGVELTLINAFGNFLAPIEGSLTVTGIEVAENAGVTTWTPVATAPAEGWAWEETGTDGNTKTLSNGLTGRIPAPRIDEQPNLADVSLRFVPPTPQDQTVAAIGGSQLLAATGSDVGQTLTGSMTGQAVSLRIVGRATEFPTLQPTVPFAIVDEPTVALLGYLNGGAPGAVSEWWLSTQPGASTSVATALAAASLRSKSIVDRAQVLAALDSDPVGLGTLGALLLGSLAAAAFAIVGFLVGAAVAARERLGEFALLRALGLSQGQLSRWLAAENAFLLILGVVAGTGIGLLLGWLIVPATLLSPTGAPIVPSPNLEIPWPLIGLVYVGALVLLVATILVVGRPLPGRRVAPILRAAEE